MHFTLVVIPNLATRLRKTVLIESRKRICSGLKMPRCGLTSGMRSPLNKKPGFNSTAVR
jgi:hypothetical protein